MPRGDPTEVVQVCLSRALMRTIRRLARRDRRTISETIRMMLEGAVGGRALAALEGATAQDPLDAETVKWLAEDDDLGDM
jgi:hypothetical protein